MIDASFGDTPYRAGLRRLRARCDGVRSSFPISIWYPTASEETRFREGIYDLAAAVDAPPADGPFRLIALSHGSGGSDTNHHDWAETLARNGYVVAAPRHVGDSHDVNHGMGSREQMLERPRQVQAAIDMVLGDPVLGPQVDPSAMGMLGFSAGGYTSLVLLGAKPDFGRWGQYCRRHPDSAVLCPVGKRPSLPVASEAEWDAMRDKRIRAAALFAPFALLFEPNGLGSISVPVRLYRAADESVARNPVNADAVAEHLGRFPEVVTVPGDHYVFIAPINEALARRYAEFYIDAPGVDRQAIHTAIGRELVDFFDRSL